MFIPLRKTRRRRNARTRGRRRTWFLQISSQMRLIGYKLRMWHDMWPLHVCPVCSGWVYAYYS
jgi:hypothetical protein